MEDGGIETSKWVPNHSCHAHIPIFWRYLSVRRSSDLSHQRNGRKKAVGRGTVRVYANDVCLDLNSLSAE